MAIFSWCIVMTIVIISSFMPLVIEQEMRDMNFFEASDFQQLNIYSYANYVRDVFRNAQQGKTLPEETPLYVPVHGQVIEGTGTPVLPPDNLSVPYISEHAVSTLGLGNVLVLDDEGKYWLYIWSLPGLARNEAEIKMALARDRSATYYIKHQDRLIYANRPDEWRPIAGGFQVADAIPDGAAVIVSQPIEHGPTDKETDEAAKGNTGEEENAEGGQENALDPQGT